MARSYDLTNVTDDNGRAIGQAWCRAWNVTDPANPVLVEEQFTSGSGTAFFTALPDTAPVDISVIWGNNCKWYRNVFASTGAEIDDAVTDAHTQNTDLYADGVRTGTAFPGTPATGELFYRTDLAKLYLWEP